MKQAVEMASGAIKRFIKTNSAIQDLIEGDTESMEIA
jgi:hypothetical protein